MVGSFGTIEESSRRLPADCGWGPRYRDLDLAGITLRSGRDILAVDAAATNLVRPVRLPGIPKRTSDGKLWIPATDDEPSPTTPIVDVGFRRAGPLLRVRCASPIQFPPGVIARIASYKVRLLVGLDGSNPAAAAAQLRRLTEIGLSAAGEIERAIGDAAPGARCNQGSVVSGGVAISDGLSPAAATILATIQSRSPGTVHELEYVKKGAEQIIGALVDHRLIRRLSSGQIIDETRFQILWVKLASGVSRTTSRAAAKLWGTSHGFALAMLEEMVNDGLVKAKPGKEYWIDA